MQNERETIRRAAAAIMIGLNGAAEDRLVRELAGFKRWLEPLLAVDPDGTEPLIYGHEAVNVFRKDEPVDIEAGRLEHSGTHFAGGFYRVPVIIE